MAHNQVKWWLICQISFQGCFSQGSVLCFVGVFTTFTLLKGKDCLISLHKESNILITLLSVSLEFFALYYVD